MGSELELGELRNKACFVFRLQAAQVEVIGIITHIADHRHRQAPESRLQRLQRLARLFGRWPENQGNPPIFSIGQK